MTNNKWKRVAITLLVISAFALIAMSPLNRGMIMKDVLLDQINQFQSHGMIKI